MPNWKEEYFTSLKGAEMNSPVNMELVQTCMCCSPLSNAKVLKRQDLNQNLIGSQMVDRISALEAERSLLAAQLSQAHTVAAGKSKSPSTPQEPSPVLGGANDPGGTQLRHDRGRGPPLQGNYRDPTAQCRGGTDEAAFQDERGCACYSSPYS